MKYRIGVIERISHIIESIEKIEIILKNVSFEEFENNFEKQLAIERLLEIIGESSKHISNEILFDTENAIPWEKVISTRNFLSHEYFRIDYDLVYKIATIDIIPLKQEILRIKNKLENSQKEL